jgi:hypothetical protein
MLLAESRGVARVRIALDPGIGFSKRAEQSLEVLGRLPLICALGRPVYVGLSRKSFLGALTGEPKEGRLAAGLAATVLAYALGGELTGFSEYEQDDQEWGEEYLVGDLGVTVSNFTTGTVERWLDDVVLNADTAPVKHMRLAALQRSRPLLGAELIASWRDRADIFPVGLASALVRQALVPEVLPGWAARDALASRGDDLAVRDLLTRAGQAVVRAVLAVNRVYLPHPLIKWQRHLITGLEVVPERLAERLESMSASPPAEAFRAAEALLEDTAALAEAHTGADLGAFRQALAQRRRPLDPPPAGP